MKNELQKRIKELEDRVAELTHRLEISAEKLRSERTAHKKTEEALKNYEGRFALAIEVASDGLWDRDLLTGTAYFSPRWKRLIGYENDELPNELRQLRERIHPDDLERVTTTVDDHLYGNTPCYLCEFRIRHKNGSYRWVMARGATLRDESGRPLRFAGSHTDITERKLMEEELIRTHKLESIGLLAGGVAHDFNNLLTAIVGNIGVAKEYLGQEDELFEMLTAAENASFRARDLTKQLLALSKGGAPVTETASITQLLKEAARFTLRGSNVNYRCFIADDTWHTEIDSGQISQVINNLLINAGHSMPEGGTIIIRTENISVTPEHMLPLGSGNYVKISIADKGKGIPEENIPKIFEPYFTTKETGVGLGLATSYSIIKRHNGHIDVKSESGYGTTFSIYLPASKKKVRKRQKREKNSSEGEGRLLIMDDDEMVLKAVGLILSKTTRYETACARDGAEAIKLYKEAKKAGKAFDIVIMDLTIPGGMGGKETIQELKKIDPTVKAIVSSGYSDDPIIANYKKYGFCDILSKPYSVDEMKKKLAKVMAAED